MKIDDMGKHIIQNIIDQSAMRQTDPTRNGNAAETVRPTGAVQEMITRREVADEFTPRTDLINAISERIAAGAYQHELLPGVAGKISESPPVRAIMDEISAAMATDGNPAGSETVRAKMQDGYYRGGNILQSMAERIIGTMGIEE